MQVVVDGLLTEYEQTGKGKRVLILPGWGDTARSWQPFTRVLSRRYEVIILNLPGFGGTASPPKPWDLSDYAAFVAHFIVKIDKQPDVIIGHSNGGAVAIRLLAMGLLKPSKLVLLASAGVRGVYRGRNQVLRIITKTGKLLTKPLPVAAKKRLRRRVYDTIGSDMLVAEHLQETFKKIVSDDVRHDASAVTCPALLIYGANDTATPVAYAQQLQAKIPHAELIVVQDAGHFVHVDAADAVLKQVQEFLQ